MSNKDYYERWLQLKKQIQDSLIEDDRLQELAKADIGLKPQGTAVEIVARVYCKYCQIYNKLCDSYDQMEQVQRRVGIKRIIDSLTCRLLELKETLQNVESFEFTYGDNALQQMIMVPQDIEILCPFFYPFEIRQQEMQYIIDEIMSGNRIGDPTPTASEIERREEEILEEQNRIQEEKEAEIKKRLALGEELSISEESVILSPKELEEQKLLAEYNMHLFNIQRMERARIITRVKTHKSNKDSNLYLELAGLKKPQAKEDIRIRATMLIQTIYRQYMQIKRDQLIEYKLRTKLGMIMPSWQLPSQKNQLERVKEARRNFRTKYYEEWLAKTLKEKTRVLRLREGDVMEDISDHVRQWFRDWYKKVRVFDEYPWPDEGGSILVVKGETFTIEEYIEWRQEEEKRLKANADNPKTKEQIKAEKLAAREEKKRIERDTIEREKKKQLDYKKLRLNPDNDPGVYITLGNNQESLKAAWYSYDNEWKSIDTPDAPLDVIRGYLDELIKENAYHDIQLELRPVVDEMMRLELNMLKNALKTDYGVAEVNIPITRKRPKPKKIKPPKKDKIPIATMFQMLVDEGIIRKYPRTTLEEYWGDRNYAAADMRTIPWYPCFPPPCMGDVREQVKVKCLLTLGCSCPNAIRAQMLVGPKGSGKRTLVYAIATETNSILIDLSPMNVYDKFPGPKNLKTMFQIINRISRLMQPTIILVDQVEKLFYKKVPKEEKMFNPTRLQKDFFKEIIKPITMEDKILVLGTCTEPWLAKGTPMYKIFPSQILIPRTDYGSISTILTQMLMKCHAVKRDFNVHSIAQTLRGFDINTIKQAVDTVLDGKRIAELYYKPLEPGEIVDAVMKNKNATLTMPEDFEMYKDWYISYSPWGQKYLDYMEMLDSQLQYKLKADKKKAGG